ncbi:MAG: hypothetical protein M1313_02250 [Nitrospirae bacterium]|nr:hypothetical protein [Nitrospirota bacterium]
MDQLNRKGLLAYLNRCRMPDGGYCSFHDPESGAGFSNVADTSYALSAWTMLKEEIPGLPETRSWILHVLETDGSHRRSPYVSWAMESKLLAGLPLSEEEGLLLQNETLRLLSEKEEGIERPELLGEIVRLLKVRLLSGAPLDEDMIAPLSGFLLAGFGFPTIIELEDLAFLSGLLPGGGVKFPEETLYRHPVLGYVLVPGSSRSDLFILLAGLRMRKDLPEPGEFRQMRTRVLFCQSLNGGFGPVGGALPTLEATKAALSALELLSAQSSP